MTTATKTLAGHFPTTQDEPWEPDYEPWRHGGWYTDARYPSGACGCVSNNYDDKKWRIACGSYHGLTFSTRRDAANAERAMTLALCEAEADKVQPLLEACRAAAFLLADISHYVPDDEFETEPNVNTVRHQLEAAIAKATT